MEFWIPLVGSALGGALVTSIFGFWKDRRDKKSEHERWLRNEKVETYSRFLENAQRGDIMMQRVISGIEDMAKAVESDHFYQNHRLKIIGSPAVREGADAHLTCRREVGEFLSLRPLQQSDNTEYNEAVKALDAARRNLAEIMAADIKAH